MLRVFFSLSLLWCECATLQSFFPSYKIRKIVIAQFLKRTLSAYPSISFLIFSIALYRILLLRISPNSLMRYLELLICWLVEFIPCRFLVLLYCFNSKTIWRNWYVHKLSLKIMLFMCSPLSFIIFCILCTESSFWRTSQSITSF